MLTHELTEGTYDPYLADMLAPLRPVLCFGRSAKAFPSGASKHAVMCWWREPHQNPGYRVHTARLFFPRSWPVGAVGRRGMQRAPPQTKKNTLTVSGGKTKNKTPSALQRVKK